MPGNRSSLPVNNNNNNNNNSFFHHRNFQNMF